MTKAFDVFILDDAERDIEDLYHYVQHNDSKEKAESLLGNIERTVLGLRVSPNRGHYPPELKRIGVLEYREVFFKPYRIIYHIAGDGVFVHCVLDGRRDLQDLLQQRLLR